ncbi:MAG: nucleoside-diphosphate sugar epimerase/dehydratase [Bacteroidota bacterium]|nr:nucleoside-diphosphate sugar epimerase/dehydratase [Bacteroidota bacterium]
MKLVERVKKQLDKVLSYKVLKVNLSKLNYMPRWIIFLIDITIVLFTALITFLLIDGIGLRYTVNHYIPEALLLYIILNAFLFRTFRVYSGIIRHSSHLDVIKILLAQFLWLLFSIGINLFYQKILGKDKLYLTTALCVNFVFSFSGLLAYRILVKRVFDLYIYPYKKPLVPALIYGADTHAISVANALMSEYPPRFRIIGFVDQNKANISKTILDLPIIQHKKNVAVHLRANKAQALIIADKTLSSEKKLKIVDSCIEYNYKIYNVPLISDWENKAEISNKIKEFSFQDLLQRQSITLDDTNISDNLSNKTILVTGAAGSIGSELVKQIIKLNPSKIVIMDMAESALYHLCLGLEKKYKSTQIFPIIADVRNRKMIEELIFKPFQPQIVFHAAAYKHVPLMERNPEQAIFANVLGTKNIADLASVYNAERFVMISTDKAVNPSSIMGASKRIAEKYVQALSFDNQKNNMITKYITTRFGNVLGSNGSVVPLFTKQIENGGPVTITHPDIIRYFMTIPEACQLVLEAASMANGGEIYIFDMGNPVKIIDLAYKMIRLAGFVPEKDIPIKIIGLRPGEKLYEDLLNHSEQSLKTHNPKIMIAQEVPESYPLFLEAVNDLITTAYNFDKMSMVQKMKILVPEYKSLNSEYQQLD